MIFPDKDFTGPWCGFPGTITTIDSHTEGESTRLAVRGLPPIPGDTMAEKLVHFKNRHDSIRKLLTREPRGHRDLLAAVLTEPTTKGSDFGLIFMDASRYPFLCGHATIGAVTTCIEAGWIEAKTPRKTVVVDTPSGPMKTTAFVENGRVVSVAIRAVPSFVLETDRPLRVNNYGTLKISTVCVGGFFAMVSSDQLPTALEPADSRELIQLGMDIIRESNRQITVRHPLRPEVSTVDVTKFYDPSDHERGIGKGMVIYGERHMDRSPCGTGTAALLTLLHHQGRLNPGEPFISISPLGTRFEASIVTVGKVGDFPSVEVEIKGTAHVTGIHKFVVTPDDPLPEGFLI